MKKNNTLRRMVSLVLALILVLSLPMTALAEELTGTVDVETTAGNTEAVDVTITIDSAPPVMEITASADNAVTDSGMTVDYQGSATVTSDPAGNSLTTEDTSYTVTHGTYHAEGGSYSEQTTAAPDVTVEIPTEAGQSETASGTEAGTETVTGDVRESETDGTYDYTTETVEKQGSVTVTTTEVTNEVLPEEETQHGYESDLDHTYTYTAPDGANDLFIDTSCNAVLPETEADIPAAAEGYDYVLLGSGNSSQFFGAVLYTSPSEDYPDETPLYSADGVDYYIRRADIRNYLDNGKKINNSYYVEGFYVNGQQLPADSEEAADNNKYAAKWSSIQQFTLVDSETGELITTYCADQNTYATNGFSYNMKNIEDADYYTEEQAAMIRTVASNGYWGNAEGPGSLDALRDTMRAATDADGNPIFTEDEISNVLSDGVAMTATQYAIWTFSNKMDDVAFINTHYVKTNENNEAYANLSALTDIPADKQASVDLIFKLYNYLINLDPNTVEKPTTSNTVITAENAVKDLSVTVLEKAEGHENNLDDNAANDAYVTNLTFALVVTPSTENGDDMIVKVMSGGKVISEARIAGNPREGETLENLTCDENGNYTISNITLTEGSQEFNITLEGIQNLEQGIYLYSSEVQNENETSQTMVGMSGGSHEVNVSMTIAFELNVEDEVIVTEKVWRDEWTDTPNPPSKPPVYPADPQDDPGRPLMLRNRPQEEEENETIEIPEEEVPLAAVPLTGDASTVFAILVLLSAAGLILLSRPQKGKEI